MNAWALDGDGGGAMIQRGAGGAIILLINSPPITTARPPATTFPVVPNAIPAVGIVATPGTTGAPPGVAVFPFELEEERELEELAERELEDTGLPIVCAV